MKKHWSTCVTENGETHEDALVKLRNKNKDEYMKTPGAPVRQKEKNGHDYEDLIGHMREKQLKMGENHEEFRRHLLRQKQGRSH